MVINLKVEDKAGRSRMHSCFGIAALARWWPQKASLERPKVEGVNPEETWGQSVSCAGKMQRPELGRQVAFSMNRKSTLDRIH